ncbi:MAG: DNA replication/repair protein RecF [Acutalibacteraceae bacterium]|nr:DNA replication/repair protein RecF [Acutalibacteraceae bacterium]
MYVKKLEVVSFRNIKTEVLEPCESVNLIYGNNAQGKTNLLESIWLFTGAKSFRGVKDNAFIKFGCEAATAKLSFLSEEIEKNAELKITDKRYAFLNENKLKSASLLAGNFNAIVFSPNDLRLVTDGPSVRRRFLDTALGQLYPVYIEILKNYVRAVTQRNKIIKDYKYDSTLSVMLDVFENEIAENGRKIVEFRKKYIEIINSFLPDIYEGLSNGNEKLDTYYSCCTESENLEEALKNARKEDMFSGVTSVGPHREDIEFNINGISARNFGSQGQKRSVALSLKLAEAEVIKKDVGECPVCLLDDVMSELDPNRQNFILNHIKGMQTFLTCCDPSNVKNLKAGKIFSVKEGKVF